MKKLKFSKENLGISLILILSAILNFANISIEGYGNGYYAAGVKSMTMSLKNFFFVSFDPAGFVTIDKPPLGFMIQAIFAKILGFSGWSILLPEALAGVTSVWLIYVLVKKSFGNIAGLISALCLAVTPVFVATSRNNTLDNLLVVTLLFACLALSKAAEKGKFKYLIISLVILGLGFNIKMLEAYMIGPAIYITYLLSTAVSLKKRIIHLAAGTVILFAVSLSWAVIVDLVPASSRPFVGSSTNNSVLELIFGHNGLKRLGVGNYSNEGSHGGGMPGGMPGGKFNGQCNQSNNPDDSKNRNDKSNGNWGKANSSEGRPNFQGEPNGNQDNSGFQGGPNGSQGAPGFQGGPTNGQGVPGGGPNGGLQGTFGAETSAGLTRLFSKNILSDQIAWFLPLALFGFITGTIKEKLRFKLDDTKKQSLVLWFMWLLPEFIYFSFTKGLFHPYYLTMMAPPTAALAGIGIKTMFDLYKGGSWKSWFLPSALLLSAILHGIMLSYFYDSLSSSIRVIIILALILVIVASVILIILNILKIVGSGEATNNSPEKSARNNNLIQGLVSVSLIGILVAPFIGSSATINHALNGTIPCAGLELLSNFERGVFSRGMKDADSSNTKLIEFLKKNKTTEKYLLVVSSSQSAQNIIIETGEAVMSLGGFSGSDKILTLDQFKDLVKKGEIRYVMTGGMGGGSSEIMNWVQENGTLVSETEWKDSNTEINQLSDGNTQNNDEYINDKPNSQDLNSSSSQNSNSQNTNSENFNTAMRNFGGRNSGQLYDLKGAAF